MKKVINEISHFMNVKEIKRVYGRIRRNQRERVT